MPRPAFSLAVGSESETVTRDLDGTRDPMAFFGGELRRARMGTSMSQAELGQRINFSGDMVGRVETCERAPTDVFALGCDEVFPHLDGLFTRILELARRSGGVSPKWFRPWLEIENEAASLYWWEPLLVPGLLQTTGYARAILSVEPGTSDDRLDEIVAARMDRQRILERDDPPLLRVVMDESVLYRCIGSPKIMHDQLLHLAEMSCRKNIAIQIVPAQVGAHAGFAGAFIIAGFSGAASILYIEAIEGQTVARPTLVAKAELVFDQLRTEALPQGASRDLIGRVAEERWTD